MLTRFRHAFLPLALAALVLGSGARLRAEDEEESPNPDEIQKVSEPLQRANEAAQEKDHAKAVAAFEEFFTKLAASKLSEKIKKNAEVSARYNYACELSLLGTRKPDALKAFARAVEVGFWDWAHIAEDKDLDSIRGDEAFKKAIEAGKVLQKANEEKESKAAFAETQKALKKDPLFDFDFDVKTLDGKTLKLSDLKGKAVIVDVWGTWCPPCRAEIPHFVRLYEALKEKGLEIVGLACERAESEEAAVTQVKAFAEKAGIKYPLASIDSRGPIVKAIPEFTGFPTTLFIDRAGKVRVKRVGYHDYGPLEGIAKALLEAKADEEKAGEGKTDAPPK